MPIPDYQEIMLPLLKFTEDKQEHSVREAENILADEFNLTEVERAELLPSGGMRVFYNRVGWAKTYLKKAGLLIYPRRGFISVTSRGIELLKDNPEDISAKFLTKYDEFNQFVKIKNDNKINNTEQKIIIETPEEILESAHQKLQNNLSGEILEAIMLCSPYFFEYLVVDLLISMGYGGSRKEAGQAVGKSGDEGIDGIIKEDRLGLDIIYIQAKRWNNPVSRPEIQKFAGALLKPNAKKGIFITTSEFTKGAVDFADSINSNIILIDGDRLAELMIEHNVGVTSVTKYEVKEINSNYFIEN